MEEVLFPRRKSFGHELIPIQKKNENEKTPHAMSAPKLSIRTFQCRRWGSDADGADEE